MHIEVDGTERLVRDQGTLLDALREDLGIHCVKDGCAPQGQCGACSVLVDGEPRLACVTPLTRVQGRSIVTPAGLSEPLRTRLAAAFERTGGYVCGFCTPGIIVRAHALISRSTGTVDRAAVDKALGANLCRCTGWQGIADAVELAASDTDLAPSGDPTVPLGDHRFLADHANGIDFWVVPVLAAVAGGTFAAVHGDGLLRADDLQDRRLPYGRILSPGDSVADAGDIAALAHGPTLSAARSRAAAARVEVVPDATDRGAAADGPTWSTPAWDPAFLETEAAFARVDGDALLVWSQTETPAEEERLLGLAWPRAEISLEVVSNGGSYGAKSGAGPAALAALASEALSGSVMIVLDRRESILWHRRRRPARWDVHLDLGEDGVLRRIDGRLILAGGGAEPGPNPYRCPASVQVITEPGRPAADMRAEGHMQWTYALETEVSLAGVDRAASLHPGPASALEVLGRRDGVAVAGGSDAAVACGVDLDVDGRLDRVVLACCGAVDAGAVRGDVVSGAFMGLGYALSEDLPLRNGVPTPPTIRSLGLLRCGQTPPFDVVHADGAGPSTGPAPFDAYAVAAVPAAVANAVAARFGPERRPLPLKDTPPAKLLRRR